MSVGLSGNLVDFGIADVFQLIGQQRKTGILELRNDDRRVQLHFSRGMVVSASPAVSRASDIDPLADRMIRCGLLTRERAQEASRACRESAQTLPHVLADRGWLDAAAIREAEELVTRDTIFDVLRWGAGSFDFRAQEVSHERSPKDLLGAEQILMDGLRMVDEWQSFSASIPSEDAVYTRLGSFETFLESQPRIGSDERERAERVYALVDGRLSARRIIDLARLGTFDGIRCLAELHQGGAICAASIGDAGVARPPVRERTGGSGVLARRAAAAVVPLLALAGVVWWTASSAAVSPAKARPQIVRSSLESLSRDYVVRAARRALEAYQLEHGEWPSGLEQLEAAGLQGQAALAAPEGRPYYSVHRKLGPLLLSPEHR
jgi:hypothetical protein